MNTRTMIPVGHKTLRLREIAPKRSLSFSPNLYRWMRALAHFYADGGVAEAVYRVKPGTPAAEYLGSGSLMIGYPIDGYPGDTDFSGSRLLGVLCNGSEEHRACYGNIAPDLELVEGFWERYLAVGRCAIDPKHQENFLGGDRFNFKMSDDSRICLWCGETHHRVLTPRTVMDESWI